MFLFLLPSEAKVGSTFSWLQKTKMAEVLWRINHQWLQRGRYLRFRLLLREGSSYGTDEKKMVHSSKQKSRKTFKSSKESMKETGTGDAETGRRMTVTRPAPSLPLSTSPFLARARSSVLPLPH